MNVKTVQRTLVSVGTAGALLATGLLLTALLAGGSQEPFQVVRSVGEYTDLLTSKATGLRLSLTLDEIFIVVYTTFFVLLGLALREHGNPTVINLAIGAIILTGLLDAIENSHILTMMTQVDKGLPIQPSELAAQMVASQVKFLSSYLSIFLMGLSFPRENLLEKIMAGSFIFLQLPVGVLIFTTPREWVTTLVITRGVFFIVSFILTAKIFWDRSNRV